MADEKKEKRNLLDDIQKNIIDKIGNENIMEGDITRYKMPEKLPEVPIKTIERSRKKSHNGFLAVYSGDAEVFDFRPGRYKNESQIQSNEWKKIIQLHKFLLDKNESSFFI